MIGNEKLGSPLVKDRANSAAVASVLPGQLLDGRRAGGQEEGLEVGRIEAAEGALRLTQVHPGEDEIAEVEREFVLDRAEQRDEIDDAVDCLDPLDHAQEVAELGGDVERR